MLTKQEINLIWKHTHPDFRGKIDGVKNVLVFVEGKGTCICPIHCLPEKDAAEKLAYAKRREAREANGE